jgi:hypothetical protein
MKKYIGCKIIKAKPMSNGQFNQQIKKLNTPDDNIKGYLVEYPDGYKSWSPKDVFENAYREITDGEFELLKS